MRKLITSLTISLLLAAASAGAADFDKGLEAFQSGDYATALTEWTALAKQGHAEAQYILGVMYDNGEGVLEDNRRAYMWFNLASYNGNNNATKSKKSIVKEMTPTDVSIAQDMSRLCLESNYSDC